MFNSFKSLAMLKTKFYDKVPCSRWHFRQCSACDEYYDPNDMELLSTCTQNDKGKITIVCTYICHICYNQEH